MTLAKSIRSALPRPTRRPSTEQAPPVAPPPSRPKARTRKQKPPRAVDALATVFPGRPSTMISIVAPDRDLLDPSAFSNGYLPLEPPTGRFMREARPAPRGPAEIIAALAARGIVLRPSADGEFFAETEGGRLDAATRDAIEKARPLLRPFLHRTPARCGLPHEGTAPEAVTLATGGAFMCAEHAG